MTAKKKETCEGCYYYKEANKVISREYVEQNYIHKDKIREFINKNIIDLSGLKIVTVGDLLELLEQQNTMQQ